MIRLALFFVVSTIVSGILLYATDGNANFVMKKVLSEMGVLAIIIGALSYTVFTYIDNILKDLPQFSTHENRIKLESAINSLGELHKEVIENLILVFCLFLLEKIVGGLSEVPAITGWAGEAWRCYVLPSIQSACLFTVIWVALNQAKGFHTATEYRTLISRQSSTPNP